MVRPRLALEHQRDFNGGLNLAEDPYDLAPNESPLLQNVDINRRGGFSIRRGTRTWISTTTGLSNVDSMYTYVDPTGVRHLLAASNRQVKRWDGAAWTEIAPVVASSGRSVFVEMRGDLYIVNSNADVRKWSGSGTATAMTIPAYNDDISAPNEGNFVRGLTACVHNGVMFVGNVYDSIDSVFHYSRIRWSHPLKPEDWRTNDYIDIDPEDGAGRIRALVSFGDRLLVFKDRAIYAVHGYPPEGFSVVPITKEVGAPSQQAVTSTEGAIYFWDKQIGLCQFDGKKVAWLFDRLYPLIDDNKLNNAYNFQVICQYHNRRVWVSVPYLADPYANLFISLVYAPDVGKAGAWTLHTKTLFSFHVHRTADAGSDPNDAHLLGGNGAYVFELDVENYYEDQIAGGSATTAKIDAFYQTRWYDAQNPAMKKRWKRPVFVVGRNATQEFQVDVFTDYDPTHVKKTFSIFTDVGGTEGIWDVSDWDEVVWAAEVADRSQVLRGSVLGPGISKALRIRNVTKGVDWRIHGLTMKWIPRKIGN